MDQPHGSSETPDGVPDAPLPGDGDQAGPFLGQCAAAPIAEPPAAAALAEAPMAGEPLLGAPCAGTQ
jgi:hypothetical protein